MKNRYAKRSRIFEKEIREIIRCFCITVVIALVLSAKTLNADNNLLLANPDDRLFSTVPNLVSLAMRKNECKPVKYKNDEYVNGPAYINLDSQSVVAFLCEKYLPDGELLYWLGVEIKEHITKHAIYDCAKMLSLPFKPAGVFLAYKTSGHFANENKRYFLNGLEADIHYWQMLR